MHIILCDKNKKYELKYYFTIIFITKGTLNLYTIMLFDFINKLIKNYQRSQMS